MVGAGKSTVLKHFIASNINEYQKQNGRIPVFVKAGKFLEKVKDETDLLSLLPVEVRSNSWQVDFFIDGIDECSNPEAVLKTVETFNKPEHSFVISSRFISATENEELFSSFQKITVNPIESEEDRERFLKNYLLGTKINNYHKNAVKCIEEEDLQPLWAFVQNDDKSLNNLKSTPVGLMNICMAYKKIFSDAIKISEKKIDMEEVTRVMKNKTVTNIYDDAVKYLLEQHDDGKEEIETKERIGRLSKYPDLFYDLARECFSNRANPNIMDEATFRKTITDFCESKNKEIQQGHLKNEVLLDAGNFADHVLKSGLIHKTNASEYEFIHLSYQEYFYAKYLFEQDNNESPKTQFSKYIKPEEKEDFTFRAGELEIFKTRAENPDKFWRDSFQNTLRFYVSMLNTKDAQLFLERMAFLRKYNFEQNKNMNIENDLFDNLNIKFLYLALDLLESTQGVEESNFIKAIQKIFDDDKISFNVKSDLFPLSEKKIFKIYKTGYGQYFRSVNVKNIASRLNNVKINNLEETKKLQSIYDDCTQYKDIINDNYKSYHTNIVDQCISNSSPNTSLRIKETTKIELENKDNFHLKSNENLRSDFEQYLIKLQSSTLNPSDVFSFINNTKKILVNDDFDIHLFNIIKKGEISKDVEILLIIYCLENNVFLRLKYAENFSIDSENINNDSYNRCGIINNLVDASKDGFDSIEDIDDLLSNMAKVEKENTEKIVRYFIENLESLNSDVQTLIIEYVFENFKEINDDFLNIKEYLPKMKNTRIVQNIFRILNQNLFKFFNATKTNPENRIVKEIEPWLNYHNFNLSRESFLKNWDELKTPQAKYSFYQETKEVVRVVVGKNGDSGELTILEDFGMPCEQIRRKFEALHEFLENEFIPSNEFWITEQYAKKYGEKVNDNQIKAEFEKTFPKVNPKEKIAKYEKYLHKLIYNELKAEFNKHFEIVEISNAQKNGKAYPAPKYSERE